MNNRIIIMISECVEVKSNCINLLQQTVGNDLKYNESFEYSYKINNLIPQQPIIIPKIPIFIYQEDILISQPYILVPQKYSLIPQPSTFVDIESDEVNLEDIYDLSMYSSIRQSILTDFEDNDVKIDNPYDLKNYINFKQSNIEILKFDENKESSINLDFDKVTLTDNDMVNFVLTCYNYAKKVMPKYSSKKSKKTYTNAQLFAIYAYKMYNKLNYRDTIENLKVADSLVRMLNLKKIPHYTTIQKFFKKLETRYIHEINKLVLSFFPVNGCSFSLDGTGFTNAYSDIYFNTRTQKTRRRYVKDHIIVDSEYRLIWHFNAKLGPRHDSIFAIPAVNAIKNLNPEYIYADKAYDTEKFKSWVLYNTTAIPQIPVRKGQKKGICRSKLRAVFNPIKYRTRNHAEEVFSVIKRRFSGILGSRKTNLQIKESKIKNVFYNIYRSLQIIKEKQSI